MSIKKTACPHCRAVLGVPETFAVGKGLKCPKCEAKFVYQGEVAAPKPPLPPPIAPIPVKAAPGPKIPAAPPAVPSMVRPPLPAPTPVALAPNPVPRPKVEEVADEGDDRFQRKNKRKGSKRRPNLVLMVGGVVGGVAVLVIALLVLVIVQWSGSSTPKNQVIFPGRQIAEGKDDPLPEKERPEKKTPPPPVGNEPNPPAEPPPPQPGPQSEIDKEFAALRQPDLPVNPLIDPDKAEMPVIDTKEPPQLVLDAGGHTDSVKKVLFTPDGRWLISLGMDRTVRVFDVQTGEPNHTFRLPITNDAEEGSLRAGAISPDGKRLIVGGWPYKHGALGILLHVIDLETGNVERVLKGHSGTIKAMAYSRDSRYLLTGSFDRTAIIYEVNTGRVVHVLKGHTKEIKDVAFAPNGQFAATIAYDNTFRIWSTQTGQQTAMAQIPDRRLLSVAIAPDSSTIAVGNDRTEILLYDAVGAKKDTLALDDTYGEVDVLSMQFSNSGQELLHCGISRGKGPSKSTAAVFSLAQRRSVVTVAHDNTPMHCSYSPDNQLAASTGGNDHEILLWRVKDGTVLRRISARSRTVWGVAWSRDSKSIGWGNADGGLQKGLLFADRSFHFPGLDFGENPGKTFLGTPSKVGNYTIKVRGFLQLDILRDGKVIHEYKLSSDRDRIYFATLLGDKRAALACSQGLELVDLESGKKLKKLIGHTGAVLAVAPSPDGKYLLSGGADQTLRLWSLERDELLLSFFVAGRDWIAWTPQGYYAASPQGERLMGWQVNRGFDQMADFYPAGQFRASLYQPDLIRNLLTAGSVDKALALVKNQQGQPVAPVNVAQVLPPQVSITSPKQNNLKVEQIEVAAAAQSVGNHPVTALRLLVDGRPHLGDAGIVRIADPKLGRVQAAWKVDLAPGPHSLVVQAESKVSKAASPTLEVTRTGAKGELPNLYVLAIGISDYPEDMALKYASKDAVVLTELFSTKTKGVFNKVETKLIVDKDATCDNIVKGLRWLNAKMTSRDVGIISFSGHGTRDPNGDFYLVPVDADEKNPGKTFIPGQAIKHVLGNMPGKLIAIFDACHSGAAAESKRKPRANPDDLVRDLVTDDYGVIVMCSSQGKEFSLESSEIEHGAFTLGLVEAMSGKADFNRDGIIHFHELDAYANVRVRQLTNGLQNPVTGRPPQVRSFPLSRP